MKIVILDGYTSNPGDLSWEAFSALGELTVYDRSAEEEVISRIGDAEVVFVNKVVLSREVIEACPSIKFIGVLATGYNIVDIDAARERGIPVCNVPGYSSSSVTQHTMALILDIASAVGLHDSAIKNGEWESCADFAFWKRPLFELEGMTLGIIGFGSIGRQVAAAAEVFGMKVLGYSRTAHPEYETDNIKCATLDEVLAQSDIISLHCPQNAESVNIIRAENIAKMKDGAIVINTARGGCVNEQDVSEALVSGKLAWYAADVVSREPILSTNPLLHAPNVTLTPHIAWATKEARGRLLDIAAGNLRAYIAGEPVNVVNK